MLQATTSLNCSNNMLLLPEGIHIRFMFLTMLLINRAAELLFFAGECQASFGLQVAFVFLVVGISSAGLFGMSILLPRLFLEQIE